MREIYILKSHLNTLGGAEKYARKLAKAFVDARCAVTLLTSGARNIGASREEGLTILSEQKNHWMSLSSVRAFDAFCLSSVSKRAPNAVVFSLDRTSFQTHLRASNGVHAAYLERRKKSSSLLKSASFFCNPLHRTLLKLEKRAFTHPELQKLIVNSRLVKEEVLSYYNVDPKKVHVVHNGVEFDELQKPFDHWQQERLHKFRTLALGDAAFHFLFIGNNYHRKGLEPLLKGFSLLREDSVHLHVVGKERDPAYFTRLASELNLVKRVHFWGVQPNPLPFYQLADALCIPSFYDPFANVTVEALAMGVFVVSSKHNGGSEVLDPKSGAVIEELHSPESLCSALKTALGHKKTEASASCIRSFAKHYAFSNQLQKILDLTLS